MKYLALLIVFSFYNFVVLAYSSKIHPIKLVHINKAINSPIIDGHISENEWARDLQLSDFVWTNGELKNQEVGDNTHCYITYDDDFLYLAIITPSLIDYSKTPSLNNDDPKIFDEDRIELFLDVNHDHRSYYNLVLNPKGNQLDQEIFQPLPNTRTQFPDVGWNAFWKVKTTFENGNWITEIAIDLPSLSMDFIHEGSTIGFNIGIVKNTNIHNPEDSGNRVEYSAWNFVEDGIWETNSNFDAPEMFGDLVFGDSKINIKSISFPDPSFQGQRESPSLQGYNPIEITLERPLEKIDLQLSVTIPENEEKFKKEGNEKITWSHRQEIDGQRVVESNYYISHDRENRLIIKFIDKKTQEILYQTSYVLLVPPILNYDLESLYNKVASNKPITFTKNFRNIHDKKNTLKIQFLNNDFQVLDSAIFENFNKLYHPQKIFNTKKISQLKGGIYYIKSSIINNENNKILHEFLQPVTKYNLEKTAPQLSVKRDMYTFGGLIGQAVIVKFPFDAKFVFWSLASYVPWWDIDQATMSNEFVETWGGGLEGCAEPLQDRECRYSQVTILENTPARVKIKWRYALNDAHYKIYANEWVDEYYTFYPDGTGIREINLYANTDKEHEIFEAIYVNPPQVSTYQLFNEDIISIKNLDGEFHTILELQNDEALYKRFIQQKQNLILETHLKDRLNPFTVLAFGNNSILPNVISNSISLGKKLAPPDSRRGHWPASNYDVDGYDAVANNAPGHFNLGNIHVMTEKDKVSNRWLFLIGVMESKGSLDVNLARNWLNPPLLVESSKSFDVIYDKRQKAYVVNLNKQVQELSFRLENGNLLNPVFIFEGVNLAEINTVKVNADFLKNSNYETVNIENKIIVFLHLNLETKDRLTFHWKIK